MFLKFEKFVIFLLVRRNFLRTLRVDLVKHKHFASRIDHLVNLSDFLVMFHCTHRQFMFRFVE